MSITSGEISRRDALGKIIGGAILGIQGLRSIQRKEPVSPIPEPTKKSLPTEQKTTTLPLPYPELQTYEQTPTLEMRKTPLREISFFDYLHTIRIEEINSLFQFADTVFNSIYGKELHHALNGRDQTTFWINPRQAKPTSFVLLPEDGPVPQWKDAQSHTAVSHDTGDSYISVVKWKPEPTKSKFITTPELDFIGSVATEVFQTSGTIRVVGTTETANIMKEVMANSLGYAVVGRHKKLPYSEYFQQAQSISIGPNDHTPYNLWIPPRYLYESLPEISLLINA